jgi:CubicO group peptidase (beta-lactamase class C family)
MTLEEFMQMNIFSKLSMNDTTFRPELRSDFPPRQMEMAWRDRSTGLLSHGKIPWGYPAKDCCGGVGLYSTADDYAKILKALLAGGGPIFKKSSADEIMKSQLQNPQYFLDIINGPSRAHLGQTWPEGAQATFGLSSSINLEDFPGRRPRKSANWSGMPGLHAVRFIFEFLAFVILTWLSGSTVRRALQDCLLRKSYRQVTLW